jgi:hypothetical protein
MIASLADTRHGMTAVTFFVVQSYERSRKGRMIQRDALEWPSEEAARRAGARFAQQGGAAVVVARTTDLETGDCPDVVILGIYGATPEEILAA